MKSPSGASNPHLQVRATSSCYQCEMREVFVFARPPPFPRAGGQAVYRPPMPSGAPTTRGIFCPRGRHRSASVDKEDRWNADMERIVAGCVCLNGRLHRHGAGLEGGQTPLWAAVPLSLEGGASHRDEAMLSSRHSFAAIDPTRRALHALPQPSLTLPLRSPGGRPDRQSTNTHWASPFEEPLLIQTWSLQWRVHLIFKWVHVCLPMCRLHHIETL